MAERDSELLARFIETFDVLDELVVFDREELEEYWSGDLGPLLVPPSEPDGFAEWRPIREETRRDALDGLYVAVPGPFPPLYEQFILSWHWAEVDLARFRLLAHLPPGLEGLRAQITRDAILFSTLVAGGFVQFGRGPDLDYDPVCFDLRSRQSDGDCPIVKFDHEEILCNRRLGHAETLAPSFRRLVELVIEDAAPGPPHRR